MAVFVSRPMGTPVVPQMGDLREPNFKRDTPEDQEQIAWEYNLKTYILPSAGAGLVVGALLVLLLKR